MDASLNEMDYFEADIRAPDEIKREQLLEDTRSDYDRQMEEALYLSMQEVRNQEIKNAKFEEEVIGNYLIELNKRREIFQELLQSLNKLYKFDKDIKDISDIINPIIEAYCSDYIKYFEVDEETHIKIFKVLGTIRVNKNTLETLKTIIIIA
jgi:small-conductance mechanosensitive channel